MGSGDFCNEVCYGAGIYDDTTGLYYLNARYYDPDTGNFLTQDTYRGSRSRTETLNLYGYCAGNPINYTDPSGHWIWGIIGAASGAYDGYKYAKKKKYKGWRKAAAIAGGAALGAVNPFKVFKAARTGYRAYKACKYAKKARSYVKKGKALKKIKLKARHTKITKKKYKVKRKPKVVRTSKKTIKKLQRKAKARCFTAGTRIHTEKGFKAIETIKPGDRVWSENPETNSKALKKVKKIFVRGKDSLIRLAINGEVIETTDEHPFYVEGRGFTAAKELKTGDEVRLEDGTAARIESSETRQLDRPVKVYNFEVEDYHTYYVSEQKVLVHNTCMETVKNTPRLVKTSYKKANYVGKVKSKNGESPDDFSLPNAGRRGAFREAKRASGLPVSSNPISVRPAIGKNGKTIPGRDYVFEHPQEANKELVVREHFGHNYPDNPMQNRGKHFNDIYGNHYDY